MYEMNEAEQQNIIGVQANLWSEMVPSEGRADYLTMPRMTALAELGWTHKDLYASYLERLDGQYGRMDLMGIHYRLPDLPEIADNHVFIDTTSFFTTAALPGLTIRYTTDGTNPVSSSPALTEPLHIDHSLTFKMAEFTTFGRRGDVYTLLFDKQAYAPAAAPSGGGLTSGLECRFYKGYFDRTTKIKAAHDSIMQVQDVKVPSDISAAEFGLRYTGFIEVPETGIYSFFLTSNDGSVLHVADRLVVDNDGLHSDREKSGQVALAKGLHSFALDFMEAGGGYTLDLKYSKDNEPPQPVPATWFKH
jgi:hexosaminidase